MIESGGTLFDEVSMVKSFLNGEKIPLRAIDDCIFYISKYYKAQGLSQIETKKKILQWMKDYNIYHSDINSNIDNAYETKSVLIDNIDVHINEEDIENIKFAADFKIGRKVAMFLLVYAKIHANDDGEFKIRIATMSEWIGVNAKHIRNRYISSLITYGFIEKPEIKSYYKYTSQDRDDKKMKIKITYPIKNEGKYVILSNEDFDKVFDSIFVE